MPSSNKTPRLFLNKWLGADKPKKDDFNSDNQRIDDAVNEIDSAIRELEDTIAGIGGAQSGFHEQLDSILRQSEEGINAHAQNTQIHVTAEEKQAFSQSAELVVGTYKGNGSAQQKITLGFQPKFGLVFAVGDGMGSVNWVGSQYNATSGCISPLGCSRGLAVSTDGFTASYTAASMEGFLLRLNVSNVAYVYFVWK